MVVPVIVAVVSANAAFGGLFDPSLADIQGLIDQTGPFHEGMQLSTIDAIHNYPASIELDVTWRVGQLDDVFAPTFGNPFAHFVRRVHERGEWLVGPAFVSRL